MSLIKKIDLFTDKRIKYIKKYFHEINQVQIIKKQLGGTGQILTLFEDLDSVTDKLGLSVTKATQQIKEAYVFIEEIKKQNKTCNENLEKKTQEIARVRAEILDKHTFLQKLLEEHADELFKAKMTEYGKLDYYLALPEDIKKVLRSYTVVDLPIFFNKARDVLPSDVTKLNEIVRSIEVTKILIENKVLDDVIRSYDLLKPEIKKRLHKLTNEAIVSSINNAFSERSRVIDITKLENILTELYKV